MPKAPARKAAPTLADADDALGAALAGIGDDRRILNRIHDLLGAEIARRRGSARSAQAMFDTVNELRDELIAKGARRSR